MNGQPLIHWTIRTALEAAKQVEGSVVVSTDDNEIAEVSMRSGAGIPFMRPAELALDTSTSMEVVMHALDYFGTQAMHFDYLCMLEATSPQRDVNDVLSALTLLQRTEGAESIVGVSKSESGHPVFLARMNKENFIQPYEGEKFIFKRRQDIDDVFFFEGSLYISKVPSLQKRKTFYHEKTLGYEMPKWKSFEVDDRIDFMIIERLMKAKENGELE